MGNRPFIFRDISANLQPQPCQQYQQQPKILGTITLGDLHPSQIAQFQVRTWFCAFVNFRVKLKV